MKDDTLFEKVKEFYRLHKPFIITISIVLFVLLYSNDKFRATFTSLAQICTGIGAIVALLNNIKQIEKQNQLQEEHFKIKKYRKEFVKFAEYIYNNYHNHNYPYNGYYHDKLISDVRTREHNNKNMEQFAELFFQIMKKYNDIFELTNTVYRGQYDDELKELNEGK